MSENLTIATVIEKNRITSDVPFLVCLDIDIVNPDTGALVEILRLVRNQEDVNINGYAYTAVNFEIAFKNSSNALPELSLAITDYSGDVQSRMQQFGGGIDFKVKLSIVNGAMLGDAPEIEEHFKVIGASAQNHVVSWTLGTDNPLMMQFPGRKQYRDVCTWRYKDNSCGYTGGLESCDLTLNGPNGCSAHENSVNFGGFQGINSTLMRRG